MVINDKIIEQEIMKTPTPKKKKKNSKDIIKDINTFIKKIYLLIKNNKEKIKILIPIAIISVLFMIYMITKTIINVNTLNKEGNELYNLRYFNIKTLNNNEYTKEDVAGMKTVNELINYELELSKEIQRYNGYLNDLQAPYSNFMKHILLPPLNIRKDPFKGDIDTSIIGQKFLEKNPYDDIKLIQKWSNFFKNVGDNNEFNQIEDIVIGDITEEQDFFHIPITIKFIANSKRSFLLLVEKLSITSNKTNISLINEFMYNLRKNIKNQKSENIESLKSKYNNNFDDDKTIGYNLYQRIKHDQKNDLIDENIIYQTIKDTVACEDETSEYCYYKFREKYRGIPSLAYTIGWENNRNKTQDFKKFFQELPPIITINKFTFDRNMEQNISNYENIQYKGEIQIDIYGQGITNEQVDEIADLLGTQCLGTRLSPSQALDKISNTLVNIGNIIQIDTSNTANLWELQSIIENINQKYEGLSNYKKIIKLFEIYRMLQDSNLCEV